MKTLLTLLVLLSVVACAPWSEDEPPAPTSGFTDAACPDLLVIGVRGQNQSPDANSGLGTEVRLVTTRLTQLLQERHDTTVGRESIDYESDPAPDLDAYRVAVAAGAKTLRARIDEVEADCASTRVAVVGFSMGANVVHAALHDRPVGSIRLAAMIADPQRDPDASIDVDEFGQDAPGAGSLGAGPAFGDLADRAVSYCAGGDTVCNHAPGESVTDTGQVHKHFYEDADHVEQMARSMDEVLVRSGF